MNLQVAWAPNIGVKESQFKEFWDVELGVTYIPWSSMPANLMPLLEGAIIDEETLPDHLKGEYPVTEVINFCPHFLVACL